MLGVIYWSVTYASKSYVAFPPPQAFQGLFLKSLHLPPSCMSCTSTAGGDTQITLQGHLWPPDHSQEPMSARLLNASVACEDQTALLLPCNWGEGLSNKLLQFLIPVTWECKHTYAQRCAKSVRLQVVQVSLSWIPWASEGSWILHSCKKQTKKTYGFTCPGAMDDLGSRPRAALNSLPVSNCLPISSHCFFSFCFHLTVCQSTEAACCFAATASCLSIYGPKAVLVLG